jgi:hypothetical protein
MPLDTMVPVGNIPVERIACMVRDRMYGVSQELCSSAHEQRLAARHYGNANGL